MTKKIDKKIVGYEVVKPGDQEAEAAKQLPSSQESMPLHLLKRSKRTEGMTYGIKPSAPYSDAGIYITLNYIIDDNARKHPIEMFVNSKDLVHQEYVVGMTRLISGIFRQGGDVSFICEELKSVGSPSGGFYAGKNSGLRPSKHYNSLVAAFGDVIEMFLEDIGYLDPGLSSEFGVTDIPPEEAPLSIEEEADRESIGAAKVKSMTICPKCQQRALIKEGGCERCTACDFDRCG